MDMGLTVEQVVMILVGVACVLAFALGFVAGRG